MFNKLTSLDGLGQLPNSLQDLTIGFNKLTSLDGLGPLPNSLQELGLNNNKLISLDGLGPLPNSLQYLDLSNNPLTSINEKLNFLINKVVKLKNISYTKKPFAKRFPLTP